MCKTSDINKVRKTITQISYKCPLNFFQFKSNVIKKNIRFKGSAKVKGLDSLKKSSEILKYIGYVSGNIAFQDLRNGTDVIKSQAEFLNLKDLSYANNLIKKLQLDVRGNPRTMSKEMKQKLAIVMALMNNLDIVAIGIVGFALGRAKFNKKDLLL